MSQFFLQRGPELKTSRPSVLFFFFSCDIIIRLRYLLGCAEHRFLGRQSILVQARFKTSTERQERNSWETLRPLPGFISLRSVPLISSRMRTYFQGFRILTSMASNPWLLQNLGIMWELEPYETDWFHQSSRLTLGSYFITTFPQKVKLASHVLASVCFDGERYHTQTQTRALFSCFLKVHVVLAPVHVTSEWAFLSDYIGETGCTLRERMNGHRSSIKNNEDTPVAVHFTHRDHSWWVTVLERAPTDIVQRRFLEKLWINRLRGSQLFTVLNRDDGLGILLLWIQTWFCLFLYYLCQFLHFSFSPCACVNPISSFLLLPLLLVLPYLAPVHWCLGTSM